MDQDEFEYILGAMLDDAVSYIDEEISPSRAKAMQFYRGDKFGDEDDGRSQVVSRDVHDVVQAILPNIQRTFFGGERVVEFMPRTPEDVQAAEQATDYVNFVLEQDNDWYQQFHDEAVDGLIFGDGFGKVWMEDEEEVSISQYSGLDEMGLTVLASEEGELQVGQTPDGFYDAILKRTTKQKRFRVMAIPPEEFLVDRRATCFEDAEIVAHRTHLTVNDLVDMGYDRDEMMELSGDNSLSTNAELITRQPYNTITNGESVNDGYKRVLYVEAYTRWDMDGDGKAELLKVCTGGTGYKVLKMEPVDCIPFFKLSMSPNPHSFFSEGMYDRLYDVQRINSQIMRLTLDSLAQTIFPRMGVVEGDGNIEDVLNNEVGAIVRMRTPNGVVPFAQQFTGSSAFPVLDYMRQVREQRTGITGASMGVDANALSNTTREAVNQAISSGQGQIELICRNFANGLKRMYKIMLELMVRHQDQPRMIRLRNEFIPIDPRPWNANMDVAVNVALSAGTLEQRLAMLQYQWEKQSEAYTALGAGNGVVTLGQIRNTAAKIAELAGFKDASQFWMPVPMDYDIEQQSGEDDPNAAATNALAEAEQMKAQLQFESSKMRAEVDLVKQREKLESDNQQAMMKLEMEQQKIELQRQKMILDLELERAKLLQKMAQEERAAIERQVREDQQAFAGQTQQQEQNAMAMAVMQLGQMIAQMQGGQEDIAEAITAPKQVIRDEMGRIVGVAPMEREESENEAD